MKRAAALTLIALAIGVLAWGASRTLRAEKTVRRGGGFLAPSRQAAATQSPLARTPEDVSRTRFPGHVADGASAVPLFASHLEQMAKSWEDDLGIDIEVVTLANKARPIAVLAPQVFQVRRIGAHSPVGGILVLLDPSRSEARIEVSYALEGAFPDAFVGRVAHDQLAPYASYHFAGMAVMDVLHHLKDWAWLQAARGELELPAKYRNREAFRSHLRFLSGGAGAQVRIADLSVDRDLKARVPLGRRAYYAPAADPLDSVESYEHVLHDLAGDPTLELFTAGSRIMRESYPVAPFEEFERLERLEASKPLRVIVRGDRAVATSDRPAPGFVPVLLHREKGLWRVDLVETWKNLFFNAKGNYRLVNTNTPYAFGLSAFGDAPQKDVAAFANVDDDRLAMTLTNLSTQHEPVADFFQGELLFRNCFLPLEAFQAYEDALRAAPSDPLFAQTLGDRALYLGLGKLALSAYAKLQPRPHIRIAEALVQDGDLGAAAKEARQAVARNRYDPEALQTLAWVLRLEGKTAEAAAIKSKLAALARDPERKEDPVLLSFDPPNPVLHTGAPAKYKGTLVYDHSTFAVIMTNQSARPVAIDRVTLISAGTGSTSGLGDIRNYWHYPSGAHRLNPGESLRFNKLWGFTVDTTHTQLSYIFDYCWHGVDSGVPQCRDQRIDLFQR